MAGMQALLIWAAAALLAQEDRAEKLYRVIRFPADRKVWEAKSDTHRRVLDIVLKKDHWIGAIRAIETKLGRFPDDLRLEIELADWDGNVPAAGHGEGSTGLIRFNMRRLVEYQEKIDAFEKKRLELEKQGKRMYYKVPPTKYDRLVYHELTHVYQNRCSAPKWFVEGMASWIGDDPNYLYAFAVAKKKVEDIETPLAEEDDHYGRGMLFFLWLDAKIGAEGMKKLGAATREPSFDWKKTLETLTGLPWKDLRKAEQDASVLKLKRYTPAD
jgi:hypothetical protein